MQDKVKCLACWSGDAGMSLDKSLRTNASLERHRNVLSRNERILVLKEDGRFEDGRKPLGLPKVAHRKVSVGSKGKKEKKAEGAAGAEAAPAAAGKK
jgi:small basic protein (TIGR04137 family)